MCDDTSWFMCIQHWTLCLSWTSWKGQVWHSQYIARMRKWSANGSSGHGLLLCLHQQSLPLCLAIIYNTLWPHVKHCIMPRLPIIMCWRHTLCICVFLI